MATGIREAFMAGVKFGAGYPQLEAIPLAALTEAVERQPDARVYSQHERELLVSAWLDTNADDLKARVQLLTEADVARWSGTGIEAYIGQLVLVLEDAEPNGQAMFQGLAMTSDAELHEAVQRFADQDPLDQ